VVEGEEGEDVLVGEEGPGVGLSEMVLEVGRGGQGDDLYGSDGARGGEGLADDGGGAIAYGGAERVAGDGVVLGAGGGGE